MDWSHSHSDADSNPQTSTRRRVLATVTVGAATALAGCTISGQSERDTTDVEYSVADVDAVAVDGDDGETTVEPWDGDEVQIQATKYAIGGTELSDVQVTRNVDDGQLSVGVKDTTGVAIGTVGGGLESLTVKVPSGVRVTELTVDDGDATIGDVAGDLTLSVDDGSAEVGPLDGGVQIDGDDGEIEIGAVDSVAGTVDDGEISVTEATTIGDVEADDGIIDLAVENVDGPATVRADDGDVTLRLSPSLDLSVTARSDDGTVTVSDGVLDEVETSEDETRGRVGEGGDTLTVAVDDGSITLQSL
ncbi:DUF4097 family beta strand repeat protein [Halomicrobium sp. IBSBa]|uniref:DUF4097 family beta strand repeat-containing protein n=1 Tax=Halomicrobium sp. IBSBa TaxID=2778916 RepID=UPI001ABFF1EF|nr:DUF4097 family beta strand repeat-containing protein [Halomicrobium sp. IBSBa]MBO4248476.1 DUF4097 family beta strand repeat protein [Halomicrobium sp. IBSBa]